MSKPHLGQRVEDRRVVVVGEKMSILVCDAGHKSYLVNSSIANARRGHHGCPECFHERQRKFKESDARRFMSGGDKI